ncbi:MAG: outer membrane protein OmpA-like peptidoglycan-associated protein [Candidatus Omnitrophota bacterium]|jgi:outer membrane protein OmpA-like peptidoglycan-associated protein
MKTFKIGFVGLLSVIVLTAFVSSSIAQIAPKTDMKSISGVISHIDIINGKMWINSGGRRNSGNILNYTVNLSKTLVTDSADQQYLVVKDLRRGQRVTIELNDNNPSNLQEAVARKIIVDSNSSRAATVEYAPVTYIRNPEDIPLIGSRGAIGRVGYWEPYEQFSFAHNEISLDVENVKRAKEITNYLIQNPSLQVGIDGAAANLSDQSQNNLRVNVIRTMLVDAGVSPARISVRAIVAINLRREGVIPVFFSLN